MPASLKGMPLSTRWVPEAPLELDDLAPLDPELLELVPPLPLPLPLLVGVPLLDPPAPVLEPPPPEPVPEPLVEASSDSLPASSPVKPPFDGALHATTRSAASDVANHPA
jgi:hypothetical protein